MNREVTILDSESRQELETRVPIQVFSGCSCCNPQQELQMKLELFEAAKAERRLTDDLMMASVAWTPREETPGNPTYNSMRNEKHMGLVDLVACASRFHRDRGGRGGGDRSGGDRRRKAYSSPEWS